MFLGRHHLCVLVHIVGNMCSGLTVSCNLQARKDTVSYECLKAERKTSCFKSFKKDH
jgi:hypothetical protein